MARQAYALDVLLAEVNAARPGRYKVSDGGLGDPRHAAGVSDHNPNSEGVWRARDITNDPDDHDGNPDNDLPGQWLAETLAGMLGKHPALMSGAYIIFARRIISFDRLGEGWRPYSGANAHLSHVHVSVSTAARGYDSTEPWNLFRDEDDMTPDDLLNYRLPAADNQTVRALLVTEFNRGARIEAALRALAAGISPTVAVAVKDALADAVVSVDVNVKSAP